jgi:hypothetical protein
MAWPGSRRSDVATNKELLEAAAFERRRLVAAFLRGSAYDDPPGVLRSAVGGVLVALLAVAGVVVADFLGAGSVVGAVDRGVGLVVGPGEGAVRLDDLPARDVLLVEAAAPDVQGVLVTLRE